MSVAQLRAAGADLKLRKDGVYISYKMPRQLDGIDFYLLKIDSAIGLCSIQAIGKTINTNDFGDQIKEEFDKYEELLSQVYGANERFDFLKAGSIWDERNDWSMALLQDERTLSAFWDESQGSTMKDGIAGIQLAANGLSLGASYIDITYYFENHTKCIEKDRSKSKGVL